MSHLVFYDGNCGLCDGIVRFIHRRDSNKQFLFAPLEGKTAKQKLAGLPSEYKSIDSLVFIENYGTDCEHIYIQAKGALLIFWYLGGVWALFGALSYFPSWIFDWIYKIVARNRRKFFGASSCSLPESNDSNRFLP